MSIGSVVVAEGQRLLSRRMTRFFPLGLAALMIVGVIIAYFVAGDDGPDFVDDIASSYYNGLEGDNSIQVLGPMGFLIPVMAFVIGASFYGADQKTGMIEHLLTWEPRRGRLLLGRLVAGLATIFVIATLLSAFLVFLLYLFSAASGSTDGVGDILPAIAGAVVRSGIAGALFFALGFAVTVLVNNSIASIVVFLIWAFVVENIFVAFVPSVARFMPMNNVNAFVDRTGVLRESVLDAPIGGFGIPEFSHGWVVAGVLVAALVAICTAAAMFLFGRRDIA